MSLAVSQINDGEAVAGAYLLLKCQLMTARNGKAYGALSLGDRSGQIEAKLWDNAESLLASLRPGMVARVQGRAESYQGRAQLVLADIAPEPEAEPEDFLPASPVPPAELWRAVDDLWASVRNKHLKKLLGLFFGDAQFRRVFGRAPAAKAAHQAYVHGLLEHTAAVAGLAQGVAGRYPALDGDMLVCGALLHDIGKTRELCLGPPIDFTDEGRLEGHIVLGVRMLDERLERLKSFPPRAAVMLRHLILSHHGELAFGSPTRPLTPEAMALHMVDDMDAKLAMMAEVPTPPGGGRWSPYHRLLERVVYTGPPVWEAPAEDSCHDKTPARPQSPGLFDMGE